MMKFSRAHLLLLCTLLFQQLIAIPVHSAPPAGAAPATPFRETVCDTTIRDPYRYMEELRDPRVASWMKEQAAHARTVLNSINGREELISSMFEFDRRKQAKVYNLSITESNRYFYLKRLPDEETGKLYYRDGFSGKEHLLFDPAAYRPESGARFTVNRIAPSDDGSLVVVSVAADGSENAELRLIDVRSGKLLPDVIDRCRFASPSWLPDGSAFFYNRMQKGDLLSADIQKNSAIYLHRPGTDPQQDRQIFSRATHPDLPLRPEDIPGLHVDRHSGYMFAFIHNVDPRLHVYYAPLSQLDSSRISWKPLLKPSDNVHDFEVTDRDIYIYTARNTPNFSVRKTSLASPDIENAETVIAEPDNGVLTSFALTSEGLYSTISRNGVQAELHRMNPDGSDRRRLHLPFPAGTIRLQSRGFSFSDAWVVIAGWTSDYKRYRYDAAQERFLDETLSSPAAYPEYDNLVIEEVMVPSHDGVQVPLSLIYQKGLERDGGNPLLMYGYGAYGNAITPFFSPGLLLWTHHGGVLAVAHVRGGGELGDAWHRAGMKTRKRNSWMDMIALAHYTVENGYTSPEHIAVNGASAGGILVGRAVTERPDLFAAVISRVGAMNPLRGETTPNGPVNIPEFGTVSDPEECRALIDMDPYLNLRYGVRYPAALITAGINDPRVIAWQPAKFAARLQAATTSQKPVLLSVDFQSGHGIGNARTQQFEQLADVLSFAFWQTGHRGFQPEHP
ncbi:MAG: prolyl oligopeptidase family serine peptidase [Prosthecochloris sp.]|nr:prolyl oligopeptidase family serine peptidase [Prosthecochloris sp.]